MGSPAGLLFVYGATGDFDLALYFWSIRLRICDSLSISFVIRSSFFYTLL